MCESFILQLKDYGVAFGERTILGTVNLDVPDRGIVVLLGPSGTGKSTLLRTIAGYNDSNPSLRIWGEAVFSGLPLEDIRQAERPVLVEQKAKLMLSTVHENVIHELPERASLNLVQQRDVVQRLLKNAHLDELIGQLSTNVVQLPRNVQRHLSILRSVAANPKLLCVDEPTANLSDEESKPILQYLVEEAKRRAIIVVVHNKEHARALGGISTLLAGGWIHETKNTQTFFDEPESKAVQDYVFSGSCSVPSPDTPDEHLSEDGLEMVKKRPKIPESARKYKSDAFGPRNFLWLQKGVLAGTPRPGLVMELDYDLAALQRVGVTILISLTQKPIAKEDLLPFNIIGRSFPIQDMSVPSIEDTKKLCLEVEQLIAQGESIAYHCRAGMGRTGTMLAVQLIWQGYSALDALATARRTEPRWVQSEVQIAFLDAFAKSIENNHE